MGFLFRIDQIDFTDQETFLTGYMVSGELNWHQQIEVQIDEQMKTVFAAQLRGVGQVHYEKENALMAIDPASMEHLLVLPLATNKERRLRLILPGLPSQAIPLPAIAQGSDPDVPASVQEQPTAIQSTPALAARSLGTPLREYAYGISRRGILHFAPWTLMFTVAFLVCLYVAVVGRGSNQQFDPAKWLACGLFGLIDIFFLYYSTQMLLSKPAQITVTSTGMVLPVFGTDFSSQEVFLPFAGMQAMLEYWHNDSLQFIKLKTTQGIYHVNRFLMDTAHFEETRRLLWQRIHENQPYNAESRLESPSANDKGLFRNGHPLEQPI